MMISPVISIFYNANNEVYVMMQAWSVKGGQSKYTGHCCNFINDNIKLLQKIPILPEHLDVAIVQSKSSDDAAGDVQEQSPLLTNQAAEFTRKLALPGTGQ